MVFGVGGFVATMDGFEAAMPDPEPGVLSIAWRHGYF